MKTESQRQETRQRRLAPGRAVCCGAARVALLAAWLAPAQAGAEPRLTLQAAAERALAVVPALQAAAARHDEANAATAAAAARRYPRLAVAGTATRFDEPMLVHPLHGFDLAKLPPFSRTLYQGVLSLEYTLFDGGDRRGRLRAARAQTRAAAATTDATAQATLQRLVLAYLTVLGKTQVLEAHDRRLTALRAEQARVQQFLDNGRAAKVDLLRAEAELHRADAERVEHATALALAERELSRLLDLPAAATRGPRLVPVALADTTLAPRDTLVSVAAAASPVLQRAQAAAAASRAAATAARSSRWPQVGAFAHYNGWSDAEGNDAVEWNAGLQLAYPLFTGGARRAGIAAADAASRVAAAEMEIARLDTEHAVDRSRSDVEDARARASSLTTAEARFAEVARIGRLGLETGTATQVAYLDAEADLLDVQARRIEAQHREIAARSALALSTGQLDLDWLRRNLEDRP